MDTDLIGPYKALQPVQLTDQPVPSTQVTVALTVAWLPSAHWHTPGGVESVYQEAVIDHVSPVFGSTGWVTA